ncbi:MAG: prepilin-type N-terminal cleavage/methylation domain-containing protein, partial [Planctomycetaceae bacterium]|nr:prepilin-type N-terminal cleavage/methylation domain-containing protein [Planctomycetaceae bacterium]
MQGVLQLRGGRLGSDRRLGPGLLEGDPLDEGVPHRVHGPDGGRHHGGPAIADRAPATGEVAAPPPPVRAGAGEGGFSLVELLIAMALFSVLGIALIALLRQSTAFLDRGQAGSEIQDLLENADRRISEDLANVYIQPSSAEGLPDVRFNSWRIGFDTDADGEADAYGQQLSFVRSVQGEAADPTLRAAGSVPGAAAEIDGEDDQAESDRGEHRPAGGKQEVSWLVVPDGKSDRNDATFEPGLMTVYRGERFLVGGPPEKALVPGELPPEKGRPRKAGARYGVTSAREAKERMSPLMTGVLHLSFEFFTRHTLPEAGRLVVDGRLAEPRPP